MLLQCHRRRKSKKRTMRLILYKNDEYPAILKRGERVLTERQNKQNSEMLEDMMHQVANGNGGRSDRYGTKSTHQTVVNNIYPKDANSFRRSEGQIFADTHAKMARMAQRNN